MSYTRSLLLFLLTSHLHLNSSTSASSLSSHWQLRTSSSSPLTFPSPICHLVTVLSSCLETCLTQTLPQPSSQVYFVAFLLSCFAYKYRRHEASSGFPRPSWSSSYRQHILCHQTWPRQSEQQHQKHHQHHLDESAPQPSLPPACVAFVYVVPASQDRIVVTIVYFHNTIAAVDAYTSTFRLPQESLLPCLAKGRPPHKGFESHKERQSTVKEAQDAGHDQVE